jgi:hypothetical protein
VLHPLSGYVLCATPRLGRSRVGDDDPLVVGGQGSGFFSAETMFRSLNIIPAERSFPPRPSFFNKFTDGGAALEIAHDT